MALGDIADVVRRRYARKFAVIGFVVLIVVSGIGLVTQAQTSERLVEEKRATVQTNAELEANTLGQWLDAQRQQVRSLSNDGYMQSGDPEIVRPALAEELAQLPPEVAALHYVDRDTRRIVASTNQSVEGTVVTTNQSVDESLPAGTVFWNPNVGFTFGNDSDVLESWVYLENNDPSVALASPVPDSGYVAVAVIRTNVRAEWFSNSIDGTRTVTLGGFTGLILFSENRSEVLTSYRDATNTTLEARITDPAVPDTGSLVTGKTVVGYASVPGTNWVVVKEAPKSTAFALLGDVRRQLLVLLAGALLGLIALGVATARGPMRSLRTLAAQSEAIAAGQLSTEIEDENRIDEVGQVRDAFREIKSSLDTATAQANALASQQFDDPVLERTVPGPLGDALHRTSADLETAIEDLETARNRAEQSRREAETRNEQLQVLDRLLRHNLKNDMNIIRLHAESIQQEGNATSADHADHVVETVDDILEKTNKQRIITKLLSTESEQRQGDIVRSLERSVTLLESECPDAEIVLDAPETAPVVRMPHVEAALTELVDNAIDHCDHESPRVECTVERTGSTVRVEVVDNGPGIPRADKRVLLGDQTIDPLEHGTGVGLWLVYWTVQQSGGRVQYEEAEPRGSRVILELQAAAPDELDGELA